AGFHEMLSEHTDVRREEVRLVARKVFFGGCRREDHRANELERAESVLRPLGVVHSGGPEKEWRDLEGELGSGARDPSMREGEDVLERCVGAKDLPDERVVALGEVVVDREERFEEDNRIEGDAVRWVSVSPMARGAREAG